MCAKDGGSAVVSYVGMGLFFSCCGLRELLVLSDDVGNGVIEADGQARAGLDGPLGVLDVVEGGDWNGEAPKDGLLALPLRGRGGVVLHGCVLLWTTPRWSRLMDAQTRKRAPYSGPWATAGRPLLGG